MRFPSLLTGLVLATTLAGQSSTSILVDLGTSGFPSNGGSTTWNDVHELNQTAPIASLLDWQGNSTGIQWQLEPGFQGANSAGTTTPQPGSALAEFPVTATRDVMYGSNETSVITLSQLGANTLVDLVFAASRTNVTDDRSTDYIVRGLNAAAATLNPSNNTTQTVTVSDILADANGEIRIEVRAAAANNNEPTYYYYLGGMELRTETFPTTPQILGFDQPRMVASRPQGSGTFATPLTVLESTGATPAVTLSAVDTGTGQPPTWLSLPASAVPGNGISVTFDESAASVGTQAATITASATGYQDITLDVTFTVRSPNSARNLLFYGNSYSQGNLGVPTLVKYLAEEGGHASPRSVARLVGGQSLLYHLTNPTQAAAITNELPLGEVWDTVVMQGMSLEATSQLGSPSEFRTNALAILTNVRAHSPGAKAVMYQTWARGPGSTFYPGSYPGPLAMHEEIRQNYQLAVADMNTAFGAGTAFLAAAGDAVALRAFEENLYDPDWSHPTAVTTLMAGLTIYQAVYRERACDITPDFSGSSNLVTHLASMGVSESEWEAYTGIAERVADLSVRRFPGSSEDFLLETGTGGALLACPVKGIALNDPLEVSMTSPNGTYDTKTAMLLFDGFATGFHPGPALAYPEWQFSPATMVVLATQAPLGPSGLNWNANLPVSLPGFSLLLQGLVLGPSPTRGNLIFTMTDAHELRM